MSEFYTNDDKTGTLEVARSPQEAWAFTVKMLGSTLPTIDDYVVVIDHLANFGFIKDCEYETDSKGKLHIHGIILLRRGFFRKRLCLHGYNTRLDQIYDEQGWIGYINKQKPINLFDKKYEPPHVTPCTWPCCSNCV